MKPRRIRPPRRNSPIDAAYAKQHRQVIAATRRAAGLCAYCGDAPAVPGKRCAGCREARKIKRNARREPLWPSAFGAA